MIDLDINNYNLSDILKLFNISHNFTITDLKKCKKQVLKTHPDKCNLSKEYFLFFSKAYKILYTIYQFKHNNTNCPTKYKDIINKDEEIAKQAIIDKYTNNKLFNKNFNVAFENNKMQNEFNNGGYGDWLKNGKITILNKNISQNKAILEEKQKIMHHETIQDIDTNNNTYLTNSKPPFYSAPIFNKLQYDDIMKAYSETLIPVDDTNIEQKYNSFEEIKSIRNNQSFNIPTFAESTNILENKKKQDEELSTIRAYELIKQEEEAIKKQNLFNIQFNKLNYK